MAKSIILTEIRCCRPSSFRPTDRAANERDLFNKSDETNKRSCHKRTKERRHKDDTAVTFNATNAQTDEKYCDKAWARANKQNFPSKIMLC